jgi:heterogeneous nuclear ribonucleoprotein F/H
MVDTQSMARQKGNNAPQRQGSYTGNNTTMNAGNNYNNNNINQYDNTPPPPPPSNNYDTSSGNGNNYSMNNNNNNSGSGSVKRSMSTSFTMKMRGVPFEAGEKEIYDFFNPVVPIRLEQETTPRGKPPIWYAEFGSREEATEAMTFHKQYMGTRYIELLHYMMILIDQK